MIRNLEVVGEAVKQPRTAPFNLPEIAWRRIAGMRRNLIDGYFDANLGLVRGVVESGAS